MELKNLKLDYDENNMYGSLNTSFMKFLERNIEMYLPNDENSKNIYIYSKPQEIIVDFKNYDCFIPNGISAYRLLGHNMVSDNALENISIKNRDIFKYNIVINSIVYKLKNEKGINIENLKISEERLIENIKDRIYNEDIYSTFKLNDISKDFVDIIVEENLYLNYKIIDDYLENKERIFNKEIIEYWDRSYNIPEEVKQGIINELDFKEKIYPDFINETKNTYIIDWLINNDLLEQQKYLIDKIIDNKDELGIVLKDEEIQNYIYQEYDYDFNIDGLIKNSTVEHCYFTIGDSNWDNDYHKFQFLAKNLKNDLVDKEELKSSIEKTKLPILINSQGYNVEDLLDNKKLEKSKFLKSLKEEMYDYITDLSGMELTFAIDNLEFKNLLSSLESDYIHISKETSLGLFNKVNGCGSGLNVELEKDIDIPKSIITTLNIKNNSYYSPKKVYGIYTNFYGNISPGKEFKEKDININKIISNIKKENHKLER